VKQRPLISIEECESTSVRNFANYTLCLQKVTTLIVNTFYKLEPILVILGTLYAETTGF